MAYQWQRNRNNGGGVIMAKSAWQRMAAALSKSVIMAKAAWHQRRQRWRIIRRNGEK
jgi:hypothetical protein